MYRSRESAIEQLAWLLQIAREDDPQSLVLEMKELLDSITIKGEEGQLQRLNFDDDDLKHLVDIAEGKKIAFRY